MANMKERLSETLSIRVKAGTYAAVNEVSAKQRREQSEVARALLERGLAAYLRDGELFEPDEEPDAIRKSLSTGSAAAPPTKVIPPLPPPKPVKRPADNRHMLPLEPSEKDLIKKRRRGGGDDAA